tara:strand:- start:74 stop:523 length:450 start_codon:yes stop_codon:yes gene_type:complete
MLTGIGVETIGGILVVVLGGKMTPLSCYMSLQTTSGGGVELVEPVGSLGCQYDMENLRIFVEHQSSPNDKGDNPGFNHAGIKYLVPVDPVTFYGGVSLALNSEFNNMGTVLGIIGVETNHPEVKFFAEHIQSVSNFDESSTMVGIKFMF